MKCVLRRWGGTTTTREKSSNSEAVKEMERRLAAMREERIKQDKTIFPQPFSNPQLPNDPKNIQEMDK